MSAGANGLTRTVVWLIDAQPIRRAGLRSHLTSAGFSVGAEGATLSEARSYIEKHAAPDFIILDFAQGLAVVDEVVKSFPDVRTIVLADKAAIADIVDAFRAGVHGYLLKSISPTALVESLRLARAGEKLFPTELASLLQIVNLPQPQDTAPAHQAVGGISLSPQELEITRRLAEGSPNKTIAQALSITESTVKAHVKTLMRKIGVTNRTQAAIWAHQNGLG